MTLINISKPELKPFAKCACDLMSKGEAKFDKLNLILPVGSVITLEECCDKVQVNFSKPLTVIDTTAFETSVTTVFILDKGAIPLLDFLVDGYLNLGKIALQTQNEHPILSIKQVDDYVSITTDTKLKVIYAGLVAEKIMEIAVTEDSALISKRGLDVRINFNE